LRKKVEEFYKKLRKMSEREELENQEKKNIDQVAGDIFNEYEVHSDNNLEENNFVEDLVYEVIKSASIKNLQEKELNGKFEEEKIEEIEDAVDEKESEVIVNDKTDQNIEENLNIPEIIIEEAETEEEKIEESEDKNCVADQQIDLSQIKFNRIELIKLYEKAKNDQSELVKRNAFLQNRLADHFRRKRYEEQQLEGDKLTVDYEQKYVTCMTMLDRLHQKQASESASYTKIASYLKRKNEEKKRICESEWKKVSEMKKGVCVTSVGTISRKRMTPEQVEELISAERKKDNEISIVRLENIQLKNKMEKLESSLRKKENLGNGLHLVDYEQLKVENQGYNEKIEVRNEELQLTKDKVCCSVIKIGHIKNKIAFQYDENCQMKQRLDDLIEYVGNTRQQITAIKQARDRSRNEYIKLQEKAGLLCCPILIEDISRSNQKEAIEREKIKKYEQEYAKLILKSKHISEKILQVDKFHLPLLT